MTLKNNLNHGKIKVQWTKFSLDSLYEIFKFYKTNVSVKIAVNIKNSILILL